MWRLGTGVEKRGVGSIRGLQTPFLQLENAQNKNWSAESTLWLKYIKMSMKCAYVVVQFKGLLEVSSSPAASYQDRIVKLLRLQPLLLQHVSAEHVQSLLQLSDNKYNTTQ